MVRWCVSWPAHCPAGSCSAVGEVNLCDKASYLLSATIFSSGNRLHCLNLPMGENCLELL